MVYLMISQSYHWRGFPAQLSPWQQEGEVERSACVDGGGGRYDELVCLFLVTVGVWLSSGRLGCSTGPNASQEHKWSCVNSLFTGGNQIHHNPHHSVQRISLSYSEMLTVLKKKTVLKDPLTQNNPFKIVYSCMYTTIQGIRKTSLILSKAAFILL